jgi:ArsR family transcriptional regulator, nickel/cobalt-responsive transcriptional repressor
MTHAATRPHIDADLLDAAAALDVAETMPALATPSRLLILDRLREGPRSVGQLARDIEMEQSAVSHQLRLLRHLRLVVGQRRGRHVIYALHDAHVGVLLAEARFHVEHVRLAVNARVDTSSP